MDTSEVPSLNPAQSSPVWFDRPRPAPRDPISGTASYDVVVIGAGLAGPLSGLQLWPAQGDPPRFDAPSEVLQDFGGRF